MVRTLGALAAAMSGTAALLAYYDPSATLAPRPIAAQELPRIARSLVAENVSIDTRQWQQVEIVPADAPFASGTALIAQADNGEAHFYVDTVGRPSRGSRWNQQLPASDAPRTVRIGVTIPDSQGSISAVQQAGVNALIAALDEQLLSAQDGR